MKSRLSSDCICVAISTVCIVYKGMIDSIAGCCRRQACHSLHSMSIYAHTNISFLYL